ncbi:hypothetical protein LAN32_21500, partial [Mycobacterium tuberculosis]|nr:hypothetical protein [Mycobacterium tuberculosis]
MSVLDDGALRCGRIQFVKFDWNIYVAKDARESCRYEASAVCDDKAASSPTSKSYGGQLVFGFPPSACNLSGRSWK